MHQQLFKEFVKGRRGVGEVRVRECCVSFGDKGRLNENADCWRGLGRDDPGPE